MVRFNAFLALVLFALVPACCNAQPPFRVLQADDTPPPVTPKKIPSRSRLNALKVMTQEQAQSIQVNELPASVSQVSTAQYADPAPEQFVTRGSDGSLYLAGKRYFGFGTNNYGVAAQKEFFGDTATVRNLMQGYKAEGVNVLRIWCFGDGRAEYERDSNGNPVTFRRPFPFQEYNPATQLMTQNEANIRQLDMVLDEARRAGIRIICALCNNWEQFGGKRYYMKSIYGANTNLPDDDFFVQTRPKDLYRVWVKYLMNRVNTVNGRMYKNDPTILAWNLMNEPILAPGYESSRNIPPGTTLRNWVQEMMAFIRSDPQPKQLVFVGDGGERTDGQVGIPHSFINNGYGGGDANSYVCKIANKPDATTIHFYAESYGLPPRNATWFFSYFVGGRCRMARKCGRTCIVEEFGSFLDSNIDRNALYRSYTQLAWYHGAQIVLVWQIWPRSTTLPGGSPLDFTFADPTGGPAAQLAVADMLAKNANPSSNLGYTFPVRENTAECIDFTPVPGRSSPCAQNCDNYGAGFCMLTCGMCRFSEKMCTARPPYVTPVRTCQTV